MDVGGDHGPSAPVRRTQDKRQLAHLLVVDDDPDMRDLLKDELEDEGYTVEVATGGRGAVDRVKRGGVDLVVSDVKMPDLDGLDLLREIRAVDARPHVITITAFGSIDTAIRAVKLGAFDYITKPFELRELVATIERALEERAAAHDTSAGVSGGNRARTERLGELCARSPAMKEILELVRRLEESSAGVLLTGESGTGKQAIARALHEHGPRRSHPFVAVDCFALSTRDTDDVSRLFSDAQHGTVFFDEITELPLRLQPKLLRVIEDREISLSGGGPGIPTDVRVIAGSSHDLEGAIKHGTFREDLYYRLNIVHIHVPPLRERTEDILPLAELFLARAAARAGKPVRGFRDDVRKLLGGYGFPGNARELGNLVERAVALCGGPMITAEDLPAAVRDRKQHDRLTEALARGLTLGELEREYIERVLESESGNKTRTALRLGLDRKTLYRKLDEYAAAPARPERGEGDAP